MEVLPGDTLGALLITCKVNGPYLWSASGLRSFAIRQRQRTDLCECRSHSYTSYAPTPSPNHQLIRAGMSAANVTASCWHRPITNRTYSGATF